MEMKNNKTAYGWTEEVDSHLIKNSEWGVVAYLCYSAFGSVPQINGNESRCADTGEHFDFHTGAGPKAVNDSERYGEDTEEKWSAETHGYNTALGQLASTTGNVYGVYDMSGCSWCRVAAIYDNGNARLSKNGNSVKVNYFDISTNTLNPEYTKYWEAYEANIDEEGNKLEVMSSPSDEDRYKGTAGIWKKLEENKGIGMNEVAGSWSYLGLVNGTNVTWKVNTTDTKQTLGTAWNNNLVLIGGITVNCFIDRGDYSRRKFAI